MEELSVMKDSQKRRWWRLMKRRMKKWKRKWPLIVTMMTSIMKRKRRREMMTQILPQESPQSMAAPYQHDLDLGQGHARLQPLRQHLAA